MSFPDFRHIAARTESGKAERLFRAVVAAFCQLTRPSKREIAQLEDLTLPLFDSVSPESRRFVAAALSECDYPPGALVQRLCDETVDIAAPLLVRSKALADVDLIALIGRHGLPHARAIARRKELNPAIAELIKALEKPTLVHSREPESPVMTLQTSETAPAPRIAQIPGKAAEDARHRLRAIMVAGHKPDQQAEFRTYDKLRETALTGHAAFFQTALADCLGVDLMTVRSLTASSDYSPLLTALRSLELSEDQAFLIAVAVFPASFPHPEAIRRFLERYRALEHDTIRDRIREWKAQAISHAVGPRSPTANTDSPAAPSKAGTGLRA